MQRNEIAHLESKLNELSQAASDDRHAAEFVRSWLREGKVVLDEQGVPNIIGNREEVEG